MVSMMIIRIPENTETAHGAAPTDQSISKEEAKTTTPDRSHAIKTKTERTTWEIIL